MTFRVILLRFLRIFAQGQTLANGILITRAQLIGDDGT